MAEGGFALGPLVMPLYLDLERYQGNGREGTDGLARLESNQQKCQPTLSNAPNQNQSTLPASGSP